MIDISGKWFGQYTYGWEYDELEGTSVNFEMVIKMLEDGTFEGSCKDEEDVMDLSIVPDKISGFVEENYISFLKVMGSHYELAPDGTKVLSTRLQEPSLHYYGNYDAETVSFFGEWEIEAEDKESGIEGQLLIWTGTWSMQRI